ncbi:MAG: urease subunit beta [Cyanobacteria bacterium P01_E01_bin.34]
MAGRKQPSKGKTSTKSRSTKGKLASKPLIPGELLLADDPISANIGRATISLDVNNTGDRPVQVGSHFHFFEVNRALHFDRPASLGMRLNIPSGNAVRFEPGQTHSVTLVALGGKGLVHGFNDLVSGSVRSDGSRLHAVSKGEAWLERNST